MWRMLAPDRLDLLLNRAKVNVADMPRGSNVWNAATGVRTIGPQQLAEAAGLLSLISLGEEGPCDEISHLVERLLARSIHEAVRDGLMGSDEAAGLA
jgi:hypothetical protein